MKVKRYGYVSLYHSIVADISSEGRVYIREGLGSWSTTAEGAMGQTLVGTVDRAGETVHDASGNPVGHFSGAGFSDLSGALQGRLLAEDFLYLGAVPADYAFWRIVDSSGTPIGLVMGLPSMARQPDQGLAYAVGAALLVLAWAEARTR